MVGSDSIDRSKRADTTSEPWRPAWVDLTALFPRPAGADRRVTDGVDVSQPVMGLVRQWIQADGGLWIGRCNYRIPYLDGRPGGLDALDQWLPETVLAPRITQTHRGL